MPLKNMHKAKRVFGYWTVASIAEGALPPTIVHTPLRHPVSLTLRKSLFSRPSLFYENAVGNDALTGVVEAMVVERMGDDALSVDP